MAAVLRSLLTLLFFISSASALCQNDQSLALLQFKQSFNIVTNLIDFCDEFGDGDQSSYPKTIYWNDSIDCCLWDGVTCDESSGQVIELDLSCSRIHGPIDSNSTLFQLSHLKKLNLAFNSFHRSISHKFGDFSYLTHLNLSFSFFTGQIPSAVLYLPNLISLDLSFTDLNLKLQNFKFLLQNSTQLRELLLDEIPIYSTIPQNLSSLITTLSLRYTGLHGSLPSSIFHLPNLQKLMLSGNENLTIHFPNTRWNSSLSLTDLDLSYTRCSPNILEPLANLSRVQYLSLANCGLSGKVSEIILNLRQLTTLDLSSNHLVSGFADLFIRLGRLKALYIYDNDFIGHFPSSVTNLTQLKALDIADNSLYGTLPSWLFNLSTLYSLYLSSNNFSGTIEVSMFSSLKRLWHLNLSNNLLSLVSNSKINSTSWSEDLVFLRLSSCNITNLSFLRDSKSLHSLDLSNNKIQGRIPEWAWSNWRDTLSNLNLSHNSLTSVEGIPIQSLLTIDLRFNFLEGLLPIPPPTLAYFFASHNKLRGELPLALCNLSSIYIMDLANNNLSGAILQCLGNASEFLEVLDMHNNEFRGSIPTTFTVGNQLHTLNLRGNKLEGTIPRSLASCMKLEVLDLGNNNLNDIFPEWLITLPKLQVLSLRSNKFYGTINTSRTEQLSSQLKIIDLSHNEFTGNLPVWLFKSFTAMKDADEARKPRSYFGDEANYYKDSIVLVVKGKMYDIERILTVFTTIDLSSNKFEGNIPGAIGELLSLRDLNLSHNMLCGRMPHSLGKLSMLESLDFSSNKLVGEIPNELASLTFLSVLNLSHNHLTGCMPMGNQFNTFEKNSYEGNDSLLGYPMTKGCGNGDSSQPPTLEMLPQKDDSSILDGCSWRVVLLGYCCGIVFGLLVGSLMLLIKKPYWITGIVEEEGCKIMMKAKRKRSKTQRS